MDTGFGKDGTGAWCVSRRIFWSAPQLLLVSNSMTFSLFLQDSPKYLIRRIHINSLWWMHPRSLTLLAYFIFVLPRCSPGDVWQKPLLDSNFTFSVPLEYHSFSGFLSSGWFGNSLCPSVGDCLPNRIWFYFIICSFF